MIKIYSNNLLRSASQTTTASTNNAIVGYIYDLDRDTNWVSSGSSDAVEETITVVFGTAQTITDVALISHNFKEYDIQYWNGSAYTAFSTAINETANTAIANFHSFNSVSTLRVRIRARKTIVSNAEKSLVEFYVGNLYGTFIEDLTSKPNSYDAFFATGSKIITKSNGGKLKYTKGDKYYADVKLKEMFETTDQTLLGNMFDYGEFAIYPCGGDVYTQKGWRIQDFYHVIIDGEDSASFSVGRVASMGLDYKFKLYEQ